MRTPDRPLARVRTLAAWLIPPVLVLLLTLGAACCEQILRLQFPH